MTAQSPPSSLPRRIPRPLPPRRARRFGISTKLQIAFCVVAGMTVIAAAVAFLSFDTMESGLRHVTDRQVPVTIDAMRLSAISRDISATAARFISARTVADQSTTLAAIDDKRVELATVLGRMQQHQRRQRVRLRAFVALSQRLEANLAALEEAITQRTALRAQIESLLSATAPSCTPRSSIVSRSLAIRSQQLELASREPTCWSA